MDGADLTGGKKGYLVTLSGLEQTSFYSNLFSA